MLRELLHTKPAELRSFSLLNLSELIEADRCTGVGLSGAEWVNWILKQGKSLDDIAAFTISQYPFEETDHSCSDILNEIHENVQSRRSRSRSFK